MCDLRTDFSFLPRPNLRILSSSRYRDPLFLEASCSSRPPKARDSRESAHKHNTINADNLGSPRSASFPPAPLQRAAVLDNQFFVFCFLRGNREDASAERDRRTCPLTRRVALPGARVYVRALRQVYRPIDLEHAQVLLV